MPYRLNPSDKRCVEKFENEKWVRVKCHETMKEALAHQRALHMNVDKTAEQSNTQPDSFLKKLAREMVAAFAGSDQPLTDSINTNSTNLSFDNTNSATSRTEGDVALFAKIAKVDGEKRVFTAIVLEPLHPATSEGDKQNDYYTAEEIEKANMRWSIKNYGQHPEHTINHTRTLGVGKLIPIENAIAKSDFVLNNELVPEGTWYQTYFVADDNIWKGVKEGIYIGLSIHGRGKRKELYVS